MIITDTSMTGVLKYFWRLDKDFSLISLAQTVSHLMDEPYLLLSLMSSSTEKNTHMRQKYLTMDQEKICGRKPLKNLKGYGLLKQMVQGKNPFHLGIEGYNFYEELSNTAQKMEFSIKNFFSKCDQIRMKTADLVTLAEEILNEKLNFLLSLKCIASAFEDSYLKFISYLTFYVKLYFCAV